MADIKQHRESDEVDANATAPSDADGALDTIVDELRVLLAKQHAGVIHADELAISIDAWLAILVDHARRLCTSDRRQSEAEADGEAEDITDVLAMALSACLHNKWRDVMDRERNPIGKLLCHAGNMEMLLEFLSALLSPYDEDNPAPDPETGLTACEVIYALGRLAQSHSEITTMLEAWRQSPFMTRRDSMLQHLHALSTHEASTEQQRLAICYVRFVSEALHDTDDKENKKEQTSDHKPILRSLAGRDILHWRQHTWEKNWQLFDSPFFCMGTFGSATDCEAMVKRILQGFSIPQVDATDAAVATLDLGAFLLTTDYFDALLGLRHKVDVTLVKDGKTHPDWQLNDVLWFEDIMDAFKSKYTIGIRGVHARSRLIANVCSALQEELKQHVNANIYFFVIQLKGKKHWHMKEHVGVLPTLYSALSEPPDTGATEQLVLQPGNVLYIPRGTPHCADTKGLAEDSIHLTIGVEIEAQFTNQQLVLDVLSKLRFDGSTEFIDRSQLDKTVEATMESEMLQNEMRGGLMSWHLENELVFKRKLTELLSKLQSALGVFRQEEATSGERQDDGDNFQESRKLVKETLEMFTTNEEKSASLRQKLLEDRNSFLSSRQKLTGMFALLHRSLHGDTTAAPGCHDKFQTNKKIKLKDS